MLVSVIIPNYNHSLFLKLRIDSVLNQSYHDIEVIILDDCSKDNSQSIIEQYRQHPKVSHIIFNENNSGSTFRQWNKGISLARGEWIWIAESDDKAAEFFLERLISETKIHKDLGIVFSQSFRLNKQDEVTGDWLSWTTNLDPDQFKNDFQMNGQEFINRFLIHKNTIPNASGVLFKKDIYLKVGGADETVKNCSDWLLWIKMLLVSNVAFVAKPLNYFRYHDGSVIATAIKMSSSDKYWEIHDRTMRKKLKEYLESFTPNTANIKKIIKKNNKYILEDEGREAVFEINKKHWLSGTAKLVRATLAGPTLSFIRLLFSNNKPS